MKKDSLTQCEAQRCDGALAARLVNSGSARVSRAGERVLAIANFLYDRSSSPLAEIKE